MEKLNTIIQHVADKEFVQFGDELKTIIQEKLSAHPRMVRHASKVKAYEEQQEIYSKVEQYIKEPESAQE